MRGRSGPIAACGDGGATVLHPENLAAEPAGPTENVNRDNMLESAERRS
jgi:hypothetical protein